MTEHDHGHFASDADTHHEPHGSPRHYLKIWAILTGLLLVSICGPMVGIRWLTLMTAFGIAIVKAAIVASEFMHLRFEKRFVSYLLVVMLFCVGIFFFGIAPDAMKSEGQRWKKTISEESLVNAAKSSGEEHGD